MLDACIALQTPSLELKLASKFFKCVCVCVLGRFIDASMHRFIDAFVDPPIHMMHRFTRRFIDVSKARDVIVLSSFSF